MVNTCEKTVSLLDEDSLIPYNILAAENEKKISSEKYRNENESKFSKVMRRIIAFLEQNAVCKYVAATTMYAFLTAIAWCALAAVEIHPQLDSFGPFLGLFMLTLLPFLYTPLSLSVMCTVAVQSMLFQVVNVWLEALLAKYLGVDLGERDTSRESEMYFFKYIAIGAVVALLDALALFFACRNLAFSPVLKSPKALAFYAMLCANVMSMVHFLFKSNNKHLANLPPIDTDYWRNPGGLPFTTAVYFLFGVLALVLGGCCVGAGMQMCVAAGGVWSASSVVLSMVAPFILRLLGIVASAVYERFGNLRPGDDTRSFLGFN